MDVGTFLGGIQTVDLLLVLFFMAFFVLGFAQGTIRRLIGIASILFSFFLAANLYEPLGNFLAGNWTQFSKEYSYMVGFLIGLRGRRDRVRAHRPGLVQAHAPVREGALRRRAPGRVPGAPPGGPHRGHRRDRPRVVLHAAGHRRVDPDELPFLRDLWGALDSSRIVDVYQATIIPAFFAIFGFLVPESIQSLFPSL